MERGTVSKQDNVITNLVDDQQETVIFKTHTYLKEHIPGLLLFVPMLCLGPSPPLPLGGLPTLPSLGGYHCLQ